MTFGAQRLRRSVEQVMASPDPADGSWAARGLHALSLLYGAAVRVRAGLYRRGLRPVRRLPCAVIAVGNLTVGGTGKTPMTVCLASMLLRQGRRVAILSRGYRGGAEQIGGVVSDGRRLLMDAATAGDEPYMLATLLPEVVVAVGRRRFAVGQAVCRRYRPDVILLDDGFQHLALARDLNLVLLDHARPWGNGHLLPRGVLREPSAALDRGDAFVLTGGTAADERTVRLLRARYPGRPVWHARRVPVVCEVLASGAAAPAGRPVGGGGYDPGLLRGRRVFVFCGLADNAAFERTVAELGGLPVGVRAFADHHRYSDRELADLGAAAVRARADMLVTTAKDFARCAGRCDWPLALVVLGVELDFGPAAAAVEARLLATVDGHRRSAKGMRA